MHPPANSDHQPPRSCIRPRIRGLVHALALVVALAGASFGARSLAAAGKGEPLPAFALIDQHGRPVTAADLKGKPTVLHFGFTHCPVICPTTLYEIKERLADLGPDADRIRFIFVTVDPARDTPDLLKEYISSFDDRIVGLTGAEPEIRRLADGVGAKYERHPAADGSYDMDHSVEAFLLDANGARAGVLHVGYGAEPAKTLKILLALIGAAAAN